MKNLDEIDIAILRELQRDAKLTTKELAEAVNLSPSPVFERLKRLESEGYILKYVAVIDPQKVGNGIIVLCNIRLKKHSKELSEQFTTAVAKFNEVTICYNTSGDYDYILKIYVQDMHHYQDFVINKLGAIESVGSVHSMFVIGEMKDSHTIPIFGD
jgi:Lrp/AsnC family leucine-responsive transcriptional regulator